jgi:hypothetical protein
MPAKNEFQTAFDRLTRAIDSFETKKASILEKAFQEGGAALVVELVNEVEALKDARFELLRANLDKNNAAFSALVERFKDETEALGDSIKRLQTIAKVLEGIANVVNLIARLIVRFAI